MKKRILLTGGGSGGHIFPLVAVAHAINKFQIKVQNDNKGNGNNVQSESDIQMRYFGPKDIYSNYIAEEGIEIKNVISAKLRRYFSWSNFIDAPKFIISIFQALWKVYWYMPDVAFSKGGAGSLPILFACYFYHIPVIIHESDSVPGIANVISGKFAQKIALSFASAKKYFPHKNTQVVGNPIREKLLNYVSLDPFGAKSRLGLDNERPLILILGGSLGSVRINNFITANLKELLSRAQIIHQVGTANYDEIKKKNIKNYQVIAFLEKKYGEILAASDLIISRAGGTIFEIAAFGKPSILIPLPEAANNHQQMNAYEYSKTGAAITIEEPNLLPSIFLGAVDKILNNPKQQVKMRLAAIKFSQPDAAKLLAESILRVVDK